MNPEVSVIVPVYNTADYLKKCIDSFLAQTFTDFELLLIDDGSTDGSGQICDEFGAADERIRVIHQINARQAAARNNGLDHARGRYIAFADSDDYVEANYLEKLYKAIQTAGADVAMCNCFLEPEVETDKHPWSTALMNQTLTRTDFLPMLDPSTMIVTSFTVPWNKLYSARVFKDLRYETGVFVEDERICHYIFDRVQAVTCISEKLYHYIIRDSGSNCAALKNKQSRFDRITALQHRIIFLTTERYMQKNGAGYLFVNNEISEYYKHYKVNKQQDKFLRHACKYNADAYCKLTKSRFYANDIFPSYLLYCRRNIILLFFLMISHRAIAIVKHLLSHI